jgi:hypothetical protein
MATNPVPAAPVRARGDNRALLLILAVGLQLALIGAYLGVKTLSGGEAEAHAHVATPPPNGPTGSGGYGIASDVRTSFGSIVVGSAQTLKGLGAKPLAGGNHGIGKYVPQSQAQVQVTVDITNRTREQIAYSPSQFTLISGKGEPIVVTRASIKPAMLLPDAAVEATLIFVAPRNGQKLKLAFKDAKRDAPFLVDLGRVDTAPTGTDDHSHS